MRALKSTFIIFSFVALFSTISGCSPSSVDSGSAGTVVIGGGGTTTTVAGISVSANPTTVPAGARSTITAHVVDSIGAPIANATVTFSLSDPTKAQLSLATAVTNSMGDTSLTLTAGSTAAPVTVNAAAGSKTGNITVTISGQLTGGSMNIVGNPSTLTYNSSSSISVTVTDSLNAAVVGATVDFTLSDPNLGALSYMSRITDNQGMVTNLFTSSTSTGTEVITATTSSVLQATLNIPILPPTGSGSLTLTASSPSIATYGTSTLSAVLKDNTNMPIIGATVDFARSDTTLGAGTLSSPTAITNSSGVAQVVFTAGSLATTQIVTASYATAGLSAQASIGITASPPATLTMSANPMNLLVLGSSMVSALVKDAAGNPVANGIPVTFSLNDPSLGTLSSTFGTTANNNGTATTTFTASNKAGAASITATAGTASGNIAITISPAAIANIAFVSANPQFVGIKTATSTPTSIVTFKVTDVNGTPVNGASVTFVMSGPGGGAYITGSVVGAATATSSTDLNGLARVTLHSGTVAGPVTIVATTYVNSGVQTTLSGSITAGNTSIALADASGLPNSGLVLIDTELISYASNTSNTLGGCTRGDIGTTAASHTNGTQVYGQSAHSTSATQISIGGGIPSASHFTLTSEKYNMMGLTYCDLTSTITAILADAFGNYNIPTNTTVNFYSESGASIQSGSSVPVNSKGEATATLRACPGAIPDVVSGVTPSFAGYFGSSNEPWTASDVNPRDGWVTILATTMGEESYLNENSDGVFTRSYSTTACPPGYTCECDGGTTNEYGGCITSQKNPSSSCNTATTCATGRRSEGFIDISEPFYDVNDDGLRDDGQTAPFELSIDINNNGQYDGPNGLWDGPDCNASNSACLASKMIWKDIRLSLTYSTFMFWPHPDIDNCFDLVGCSAYYANSGASAPFAVAPPSIQKGGSGTFCGYIGDANLNRPPAGTVIAGIASPGTVVAPGSVTLPDRLSTGPAEFCFTVRIGSTDTASSTNVGVTVDGLTLPMLTVPLTTPPLSIVTAVLANATNGVAYNSTLVASGGTPPYLNWVVTAGALPGGLTLDPGTGTISGTPTATGTFNFTVRVSDSTSTSVSRNLSLTVN